MEPLTVNPALALAAFLVLSAVTAVTVWPRRGLVPRLLQMLRMTERVRIEDALKHLHEQEYLGRPATIAGLAGILEMPRGRVVKLVGRIEEMGLIRSDGKGLPLTDHGRAYARRVIRSHRLWERYLADRTSVKPTDWHDEAELREHSLTPEDANELDARMGYPRYDPHGDPIPTSDGELPPRSGVALNSLEAGQYATIVHLEDEPQEVYVRLVTMGLAPLMEIEVVAVTPAHITFRADGEELMLEPVAATNITVQPLPYATGSVRQTSTLDRLGPGMSAEIVRISPACRGAERRRLLDLGIVPGTVIRSELEGAMQNPIAYRIRGALIALRKSQAAHIYVGSQQDG